MRRIRNIWLIVLVALLASCHGEVTVTPSEGVAITFSGSESEESTVTRAEGTSLSAKRDEFRVWGYKNTAYDDVKASYDEGGTTMQTVFPGYTVNWTSNSAGTTTTNTNNWEYILPATDQTVKYWDWGALAYRFFAVTNWQGESAGPYAAYKSYGANGTYTTYGTYWADDAHSYKAYAVSMLADASDADEIEATPFFSRLWFSTGNLAVYPDKQFGKPVTLEFLKPYTRVRFIFKYVFPREGIKLADLNFKPTDGAKKIARKGTVTIIYPMTGTETKEWFTASPQTGVGSAELEQFVVDYDPEDDTKNYVTLSGGKMTADGWYIVLPSNTQGTYTLSVKVNGEDKTAVVPEQYMQWLPGYSYTYVFKITDEGGVEIGWVEYAVTKWTELETEHTVYNW